MSALLLLTACTQDPAPVRYNGSQSFGHEHWGALDSPNHQTYPVNSPKYKPTYTYEVTPAKVPEVAVADLPAPNAQAPNVKTPNTKTPNTKTKGLRKKEAPAEATSYSFAEPAAAAPAPAAALAAGLHEGSAHFLWPVTTGKVILHFGAGPDGKANDGINIATANNDPILAAANGTVVYVGELAGYGNMVILKHDGGWMTAYAHAADISVSKGDKVKRSDTIGHIGTTGGVKRPQLHFALRKGKTAVDPEKYLPQGGLQG